MGSSHSLCKARNFQISIEGTVFSLTIAHNFTLKIKSFWVASTTSEQKKEKGVWFGYGGGPYSPPCAKKMGGILASAEPGRRSAVRNK
jgi:hypothetical protein